MIKVQGQNPMAIRRLEHHARNLAPIAQALENEILFGWIGKDSVTHIIRQSRAGLNSFALHIKTPNGYDEFHFRKSSDGQAVEVYDSYRLGARLARFEKPVEARNYIRAQGRMRQLSLVA